MATWTVRELVRLGRLPHLGLFGTPGPEDERGGHAAMQATERGLAAAPAAAAVRR